MDKEDTDTAAQVNFPKGLYLGFNQTHHTRKCAKYVLHMWYICNTCVVFWYVYI